MPLDRGTRLGSDEIVGLLGTGGMGEVYRACDTKLRREVALKVLPEVFAADPDRVARFTREAQVLATLNHSHIAAIYGVDESAGVTALVLELVDGPTLVERIEGLRAKSSGLPDIASWSSSRQADGSPAAGVSWRQNLQRDRPSHVATPAQRPQAHRDSRLICEQTRRHALRLSG
jgi:hypothetical protein